MQAGEFRRCTHLDVLKGIRRNLLARFLDAFAPDLAARNIALPSPSLGNTDFLLKAEAIFTKDLPDTLTKTLAAFAVVVGLQILPHHSTAPPLHQPIPRYALRKGFGFWNLTFDGEETVIKHEKGVFYVAWLLHNPPEHPIHALDLSAKIPEIYRQQLGLAHIADPSTGRAAPLLSGARIQERSLALDDAQAARALFRKQRELEAILDSEDESEPVKAEALRELEAIAEFQRQHGRRTADSAQRAGRTVRQAITRLHQHLQSAVDTNGNPHSILRPFARYIHHALSFVPSC